MNDVKFDPNSEMRRKLAGAKSSHDLHPMNLYNGEPGQRFRMQDGAEYEISLKFGFKRLNKPQTTKKERNRARKFLRSIQPKEN